MCDWNGNDYWGAAVFCVSQQDENLGGKNYLIAGKLLEKIWSGADGAGFGSGLLGKDVNLILKRLPITNRWIGFMGSIGLIGLSSFENQFNESNEFNPSNHTYVHPIWL